MQALPMSDVLMDAGIDLFEGFEESQSSIGPTGSGRERHFPGQFKWGASSGPAKFPLSPSSIDRRGLDRQSTIFGGCGDPWKDNHDPLTAYALEQVGSSPGYLVGGSLSTWHRETSWENTRPS